jgi:hypothetical protein
MDLPVHDEVYYVTTAAPQQHHRSGAPILLHVSPNDSRRFQEVFGNIASCDMVVFDRFFTEEQFSFHFWKQSKNVALILDMQDMHSLRWGRQDVVAKIDQEEENDPLEACLAKVMEYQPPATDDRLLRELASIHRSDLTLVCSPYELELLQREYGIPNEKLCLAPFFVDGTRALKNKSSSDGDATVLRPVTPDDDNVTRFVFCGGFKHAPNVDAVKILLKHVWPRLQSQLPTATLHIYGAFCPSMAQMRQQFGKNAMTNVMVHGYVKSLEAVFANRPKSILLAPLRFGAGIKGKIVDAWTFGMPVVTTPIGSEGMTVSTVEYITFGGRIASSLDEFCQAALELAADQDLYERAQDDGRFLLQELFSAKYHGKRLQDALLSCITKLPEKRQRDFMQSMVWHQSLRSTEYFSRWIELKEEKSSTPKHFERE